MYDSQKYAKKFAVPTSGYSEGGDRARVVLHAMDLALKFAFRLSFEQLVSLFVDYLKAMRITNLIH